MKLCGGVRYGMGVNFQRFCNNDYGLCPICDGQQKCRLTDFIPHYEITTRIPEYAIAPEGQVMTFLNLFYSLFYFVFDFNLSSIYLFVLLGL